MKLLRFKLFQIVIIGELIIAFYTILGFSFLALSLLLLSISLSLALPLETGEGAAEEARLPSATPRLAALCTGSWTVLSEFSIAPFAKIIESQRQCLRADS